MGVTNGQPVDETYTNPAFIDRRQDDTAFGRYDLDNTTDPLSAPKVFNVQRNINEGHQDEKILFCTATGQKLSFNGVAISCPEDVLIRLPDGDFTNTILAAGFPFNIADGESAYVTLNRYANANVALTVTSSLPKGKDIFRFVTRVGSQVIFWDNTVIKTGGSSGLGSAFGVSSIAKNGEGIKVDGDVELKEGTNVTINRTGQVFEINALGGGGGGGVSYAEDAGNVEITLRPVTSFWILISPDLTVWEVTVDNTGTITTTSGASGTPSNIKVTKPDLSEASFAIDNSGALQVISPPAGGETLNDAFFLKAPNGAAWHLEVDNSDTLLVETDTTEANHFAVLSDTGQNLFRTQEVNGLALNYFPVFDSTTLPATPQVIAGCLPLAFYDNGSTKKLIYHDGTNWILL